MMRPRIFRWRYLLLLPVLALVLAFLFRGPLVISVVHWVKDREFAEQFHRIGKLPLPELVQGKEEALRSFLYKRALPPVDYIASKFQDHDLVLIGEEHKIRWQVELVQEAIPAVYAKGVRNLVIEFLASRDQGDIDGLLRSRDHYDSALAMELFYRCDAGWPFKEYIDILKVVWNFNKGLPKGAPPIRVLGCFNLEHNEKAWAKIVLDQVIAKGEKALVYCGIRHAFTRFERLFRRYDGKIDRIDERFGQYLFRALGNRVFTICLHSSRSTGDSPAYSADGVIDAFLHKIPPGKRSFGVDLVGTPFGALVETTGPRAFGRKSVRLDEIWDGYICHGILPDYKSVTLVRGWLNKKNFDDAIKRLLKRRGQPQWAWFAKLLGPKTMNELLGIDANIEQRYRVFR